MASKKLSSSTVHRRKDSKKADVGKTSNLSAEYVEDSDDGPKHEGSSSSGNSRGSSPEASQKPKENSKTKRSNGTSKNPVNARNKPKVNGARNETSSDETSDGDSTDTGEKTRASQKHGKQRASSPASSTSSPGDSSTADETQEVEPMDVIVEDASAPVKHSSRVAVARNKFTPPQGFEAVTIPKDLWVRSLLAPEKLVGKEIWHIIAPPDVPISALTAATLLPQQSKQSPSHLAPQETVATHGSTEYSLAEDEDQAHRQWAYQPDAGSKNYSASGPKISRVLRLQRKPLSKLASGIADIAQTNPSATMPRAKPQQPEGLRMRYQPFGVSSDAHLSRTNRPSSRNLPSDDVEDDEGPLDKRKASSQVRANNDSDGEKKIKKRKKDKHSAPVPDQSTAPPERVDARHAPEEAAPPEESETPEERARRKAERKQEKEERRARKAERRANREAQQASAV